MMPAQYYSARVWYSDFSVEYYFLDTNHFVAHNADSKLQHNLCSRAHNKNGASCAPVGPSSIQECTKWFQRLWSEQKEWLDRIVPQSTAHWRIVVTHFPPYFGVSEWRELAKKHHFDLIITGHRHKLEMHKKGDPIKPIWDLPPHEFANDNDSVEITNDFLDPVAWVVTGGGGGITSEHTPSPHGDDDQYGFMDLILSKDELRVDAISHAGHLRRSMIIEPSFPHNPSHKKESSTAKMN